MKLKYSFQIQLWLLICFSFFEFCSCQSNHSNHPKISSKNHNFPVFSFQSTLHDFGILNDGDTANYTFSFTNTGKMPLIIHDISTGCGCTVVKWSDKPVLPRDTSSIKVQFSKHHDPGEHLKQIIVNANTENPYTVLHITAFVKKV
jgi:hypothetical protein